MKTNCLIAISGLLLCLISCNSASSKKEKILTNGKCTLVFRSQEEMMGLSQKDF